jgi:hypothetical protein
MLVTALETTLEQFTAIADDLEEMNHLQAVIVSSLCTSHFGRRRLIAGLAMCLCFALLTGCASAPRMAGTRPFQFEADTFAYANEVDVDYACDAQGRWRGHARQPKPDYTRHCFVVARSARQFFQHARFDPALPKATEAGYRRLVRKVVSTSPRRDLAESARVIIPGYANLREFSRAQEPLLKEECGSFWQSYFQRGHWRMVFPFSRGHQAKMAARLAGAVRENRPPILHVVCFPSLRINHAVLLCEVQETPEEIRFATYDPNAPQERAWLTFSRAGRTFNYPANTYFQGGEVDAYEVYRKGCY